MEEIGTEMIGLCRMYILVFIGKGCNLFVVKIIAIIIVIIIIIIIINNNNNNNNNGDDDDDDDDDDDYDDANNDNYILIKRIPMYSMRLT